MSLGAFEPYRRAVERSNSTHPDRLVTAAEAGRLIGIPAATIDAWGRRSGLAVHLSDTGQPQYLLHDVFRAQLTALEAS